MTGFMRERPLSAGIARIELKEARGPKGGREGGGVSKFTINFSAMPPTVDDKPLESHEGAQLNDQGHSGESVRYKNSHTVDAFLAVLVRVMRFAHPD